MTTFNVRVNAGVCSKYRAVLVTSLYIDGKKFEFSPMDGNSELVVSQADGLSVWLRALDEGRNDRYIGNIQVPVLSGFPQVVGSDYQELVLRSPVLSLVERADNSYLLVKAAGDTKYYERQWTRVTFSFAGDTWIMTVRVFEDVEIGWWKFYFKKILGARIDDRQADG